MLQLPAVTGPPGIPGSQAARDDEASFLNFQNWLMQLVLSHSRDSVVKLGNGTGIPCLFHKLSHENHSAIE
uniref:Uncharacterized protein n=1 Tax=Amphimedon queenslandica TaxID=400682 RepID=A0A1X7TR18_AMPQE